LHLNQLELQSSSSVCGWNGCRSSLFSPIEQLGQCIVNESTWIIPSQVILAARDPNSEKVKALVAKVPSVQVASIADAVAAAGLPSDLYRCSSPIFMIITKSK
jgi:hypothetical protein